MGKRGKQARVVGSKINDFVIESYAGHWEAKHWWNCRCKCGTLKTYPTSIVRADRIWSCGCRVRKRAPTINRLPPGESIYNRLIYGYRKRAKKRKLAFELTRSQFVNLLKQNCHYCGIKPTRSSKQCVPHSPDEILYNGIDRIDSILGYSISNCVSCCHQCNLAKYTYSVAEFTQWALRLAKYQKEKVNNCA